MTKKFSALTPAWNWFVRTGIVLSLFLLIVSAAPQMLSAQTATSGEISGIVTDPTGAVVPGATVTVTDTKTGSTLTVQTNEAGRYTVPTLKPSTYKINAVINGLQSDTSVVAVGLGAVAQGDLRVSPTSSKEIVEVSAANIAMIDTTTPALVTTFNEQQIQELPAPGGDVTTIAFTTPGVAVNAGGSYGNFSADGLPGVSNLFVLNGFDNQDPFLNLNNSGSSNLTLGQAELAEASVVLNGYTTQYGRAAGAIVNYTTRSGSNSFHGLLNYDYNGNVLNANDWFRNFSGAPRQKAVSNAWAANGGGPIIKDKVFFFVDYEGLHYVLPASGTSAFPSAALQNYALANVPAQSLGLYKQAFALYQNSPAYASAVPVTNGTGPLQDANGNLGCGTTGFAGTPTGAGGTFGVDTPCATAAVSSSSNKNIEWLLTGRVDWNISDRHKLFGRYKMDHGSQPTSTNFAAPIFNAVSIQPEYEGQLNDTYVFSPHATNQFIFAANWYTAYFGPADLAATLAAFPTNLSIGDGGSNTGGFGQLGMPYYFPQGRNVTQYQFEDDFTLLQGKSSLRLGYNFRRDDVSDYDAQVLTQGGLTSIGDLTSFANGTLPGDGQSVFVEAFAKAPTAHLALYNIGVYAQEEYQALPNLKLTAGVRFDRTGNPLCNESCFSEYTGSFPQSNASITSPFDVGNGGPLNPNSSHGFTGVERLLVQPRVGFNYDIGSHGTTVVRGGVGLFGDLYPAGIMDSFIQTFPNSYQAVILSGNLGFNGAGSVGANAIAANTAVQNGFSAGQSLVQVSNTLANQGVPFTPPALAALSPKTFQTPRYLEWNVQVQRQLTKSNAVIVGYAGNYGYNLLYQNSKINGSYLTWDQGAGIYDAAGSGYPTGFADLPATPADPRFYSINAFTNDGLSNYNGVSFTFKHIDTKGLSVNVSYTWSHALDDISNGGSGETYNGGATTSALTPGLPSALNYSNADYDIRNNLVMDGIWDLPYKFDNKLVDTALGGWSIGAKAYYRSGEPFSITEGNVVSAIGPTVGGGVVAQALVPHSQLQHNCSSRPEKLVLNPCLNSNQYAVDPFIQYVIGPNGTPILNPATSGVLQTTWGNVRRNTFYGPHYSDADVSVYKKVYRSERLNVILGANSFNVFNHPNFGQPNGGVTALAGMGLIGNTIGPPTSPYGSFQGAAVTGRVLQVLGKVTF